LVFSNYVTGRPSNHIFLDVKLVSEEVTEGTLFFPVKRILGASRSGKGNGGLNAVVVDRFNLVHSAALGHSVALDISTGVLNAKGAWHECRLNAIKFGSGGTIPLEDFSGSFSSRTGVLACEISHVSLHVVGVSHSPGSKLIGVIAAKGEHRGS
jgi:hypothetical protein